MSWSFEKVLCPKCHSRVYARPNKKDNYPEFTCLRCGWSDTSGKKIYEEPLE